MAEQFIRRLRQDLNERIVIRVHIDFADGSILERKWTWGEIESGVKSPKPTLEPWMEEARRSWENPQDPILFTARVREGDEDEARAWLEAL